MTEPRTEAGRALLSRSVTSATTTYESTLAAHVAAIEKQAIDTFLASPEAAREVAEAMCESNLMRRYRDYAIAAGIPKDPATDLADNWSYAVLAAWREARNRALLNEADHD